MVHEIHITAALALELPIIDVRSPGEFSKGHIPSAINIPLLSNQERAEIGTIYKQDSKEAAMTLGLKFVQPKLDQFLKLSRSINTKSKRIVHCWRGGMRSRSFAQHLSENGTDEVYVITEGYKAYRNHILNEIARPIDLRLLGGYTGSGKTYILHELQNRGHQVIDLEALAKHKGSAFGGIGQELQPSTEQFENNLHESLQQLDPSKPIWVEDESYSIGSVNIPKAFHDQMRNSDLIFIKIPKDQRASHLVSEYASYSDHDLASSIHKLAKRLGGLRVKEALDSLERKDYYNVAMLALDYYDKLYNKGRNRRTEDHVKIIPLHTTNCIENALHLEKRIN